MKRLAELLMAFWVTLACAFVPLCAYADELPITFFDLDGNEISFDGGEIDINILSNGFYVQWNDVETIRPYGYGLQDSKGKYMPSKGVETIYDPTVKPYDQAMPGYSVNGRILGGIMHGWDGLVPGRTYTFSLSGSYSWNYPGNPDVIQSWSFTVGAGGADEEGDDQGQGGSDGDSGTEGGAGDVDVDVGGDGMEVIPIDLGDNTGDDGTNDNADDGDTNDDGSDGGNVGDDNADSGEASDGDTGDGDAGESGGESNDSSPSDEAEPGTNGAGQGQGASREDGTGIDGSDAVDDNEDAQTDSEGNDAKNRADEGVDNGSDVWRTGDDAENREAKMPTDVNTRDTAPAKADEDAATPKKQENDTTVGTANATHEDGSGGDAGDSGSTDEPSDADAASATGDDVDADGLAGEEEDSADFNVGALAGTSEDESADDSSQVQAASSSDATEQLEGAQSGSQGVQGARIADAGSTYHVAGASRGSKGVGNGRIGESASFSLSVTGIPYAYLVLIILIMGASPVGIALRAGRFRRGRSSSSRLT